MKNLNPILDEMRSVKSPREIAMVRRASQIAGLGLMEAMRSTEPGVTEYQLDAAARYVFLLNDARLEGYRSITASGTENINNGHYFRNTSTLKDGDLVLMDFAPDYRYYTSDIGRVWPVNGKYTAQQRELLQFILEWHKAVMSRIRPGFSPDQILEEARRAMEPVFARTRFSKPLYEKAARTMVETGGGVFSHTVGMAVHDVGRYRGAPLKPGQVFSVDPQLWVREENLYLRFEDTVVVTETGVENFTDFIPMELADMEKLVLEKGVVQKVPPVPGSAIKRAQAGSDLAIRLIHSHPPGCYRGGMSNAFSQLSDQLAAAVETAARSVVQVHSHRRPAAGIVFDTDLVIAPARAIGDDVAVVRHPDGHTVEGRVLGFAASHGLAVIRVPEPRCHFSTGCAGAAGGRAGSRGRPHVERRRNGARDQRGGCRGTAENRSHILD